MLSFETINVIRRAILRTTLWLSIADALTLLAFAAVSIVIARRLGAEQLGAYSLATTLGGIVQIVADAGYSIWLPRAVAQNPSQLSIVLASAIATKVLLWFAAFPVALVIAVTQSDTAAVLTWLVAVDVLASCISFSVLAALRGIEWYIGPSLLSSTYSIVAAAGMVIAIVTGAPLWCAVGVMVAAGFARSVHLVALLHRRTRQHLTIAHLWTHAHPATIVNQLRAQWQLWTVNVFSTILHRGPLVVLGMRGLPSELGYYAAAFRIYSALRIIPGSLFNAVLPQLSSRQHDARLRTGILSVGFAVSLIVAGMLWLSSTPLIRATFGFEQAIRPLELMAIAFAGLSLKTTVEAVLIGRRHDRLVAVSVMVVAACTIAVSWIVPPLASSFAIVCVGSEWCLFVLLFGWLLRKRSLAL
ncbi:MAG: hypothetical protein KatS3mg039_1126 [Candidatus Kapaibacterium sp.]|nr:MAG: hypothetical protein KatS3mg039_1126 [Candidatus Kapabacteria bacterium]